MFDLVLAFGIPLLAGAAVLLVFGVPYALAEPTSESDQEADPTWRDPAPKMFGLLLPLARVYTGRAKRAVEGQRRTLLHRQLDAAGIGFAITPAEFKAIQWLFTVIGALLGGGVVWFMGLKPTWVLVGIGIAVLGYFFPYVRLRDEVNRRQAKIEKEFPFFMDVLALSMRAGLSFPAAVQQATSQLPRGPVRDEFVRFLRQSRTGISRRDALERLGERMQMTGVQNFVAAVNQAEETGGALSDVLAEQAEQRRKERFLKAEKKANQAPVKLLFPLIALLFPITFVIIMWPIGVQLFDAGVVDLFG